MSERMWIKSIAVLKKGIVNVEDGRMAALLGISEMNMQNRQDVDQWIYGIIVYGYTTPS